MRKKILSGLFALALLGATGYGVSKSMQNEVGLSALVLANVEALAQDENGGSCPSGTSKHVGAINASEQCEVTETRTCRIGTTIPSWVPYVGGLECHVEFDYAVTLQGSKNDCIQTGNPSQYCCSYSCKRNA